MKLFLYLLPIVFTLSFVMSTAEGMKSVQQEPNEETSLIQHVMSIQEPKIETPLLNKKKKFHCCCLNCLHIICGDQDPGEETLPCLIGSDDRAFLDRGGKVAKNAYNRGLRNGCFLVAFSGGVCCSALMLGGVILGGLITNLS